MKTTNLTVVIPFHSGDLKLAQELISWIVEIGLYKSHSLLIAFDSAVAPQAAIEMAKQAKPRFNTVWAVPINVPPQRQGWIAGSDYMFLQIAKYIQQHTKFPFLWLEPDCIPLRQSWLADLSESYAMTPMRYMGTIIKQNTQPELPREHMTGCGIYPNNAFSEFDTLKPIVDGTMAFDLAGSVVVMGSVKDTKLIHSFWGQQDLAPVFVAKRVADSPKNHLELSFLRPDAVLFHRDKTHSLIPLLRDKLFTSGSKKKTPLVPAVD